MTDAVTASKRMDRTDAITVRLEQDLRIAVKLAAQRDGRTVSSYVRKVLYDLLWADK